MSVSLLAARKINTTLHDPMPQSLQEFCSVTIGSWKSKVCGPYTVTLLDQIPTFEWYMARLVVKSRHNYLKQNKKTRVTMKLDYAQNVDSILGSVIDTNGRPMRSVEIEG